MHWFFTLFVSIQKGGREKWENSALPIFFLLSMLLKPSTAELQSYIFYLGGHPHSREEAHSVDHGKITDSHHELLGSVLGSKEKAKDAMFYSYTKIVNGFAANLEEEEVEKLSKHPRVVSTFPNKGRKLLSNSIWRFTGMERADGQVLPNTIRARARLGKDIIVGILDMGITQESNYFYDDGIGPVPSRWKGSCEKDPRDQTPIQCNRKLIGARQFYDGFTKYVHSKHHLPNYTNYLEALDSNPTSPRDNYFHGLASSFIASGRPRSNANILGNANGTALGGAPDARVAAYKVCWAAMVDEKSCFDADILAAFDAAIADGVDVINVSMYSDDDNDDHLRDAVSVGSLHALKHGISVVCSAGNDGPNPESVVNAIPWVLTVGASTSDRQFPSNVVLGNNRQLKGQSLADKHLISGKFYELIYSADAGHPGASYNDSKYCLKDALDKEKVKGKIVVCHPGAEYMGNVSEPLSKSDSVRRAGGAGVIIANEHWCENYLAYPHLIPAAVITPDDTATLLKYMNSTKSPVGYITNPTTTYDLKPAPLLGLFSSLGPNKNNPGILKPDIAAPGVNILFPRIAAEPPTYYGDDGRRIDYDMTSGTSAASPYAAAVTVLLKAIHPDWSPSEIKSAIMTTASRITKSTPFWVGSGWVPDEQLLDATPFGYGAGQIEPNLATEPGLVYDIKMEDYLNLLCRHGYNSSVVADFAQTAYPCPSKLPRIIDLNYPSITVPYLSRQKTVRRTLKNVGPPGTYKVSLEPPPGIEVSVRPKILEFRRKGEGKRFKVKFRSMGHGKARNYSFGSLTWDDGVHFVRSPLVVRTL